MGLLRDFLYGPEPAVAQRAETLARPRTVEDELDAIIARRHETFGLTQALQMPAVIRAVQLICSMVAQFAPVAYRAGVPVPEQPRLLTQPAPFGTRYQFLYQTVYSLLAMGGSAGTGGDAYWLVGDRDATGMASALVVLDPAEVTIEWGERRFLPRYRWRNREMASDELLHLTIGRPAGELHGRSPLIAGLDKLAAVDAAERYALGFFDTSGIPSVVIKAQGKGSADEAQRLKAQWINAHSTPEPTPAVLFGGLELDYPGVDAQKAQLQESREYGNTIVAVLLGIPAPLLHVMTSGATITYVNAGGALDEFVRATAQPVYLAPLEGYFSQLVPRTQTVRFDTGELYRADLKGRMDIYASGIASGVMTAPEARSFEGWPKDGPIDFVPSLEPTPALAPVATEVPAGG